MLPRADDLVVIVGAGISFEAPTCAPGFGDIRRRFLEQSGSKDVVQDQGQKTRCRARPLDVDHLSPEQIFNALDDGREKTKQQIRRDLWWLCETGEPNRNHRAAATLIAAGARVWTPNFDTMIERAAEEQGRAIDVVSGPTDIRSGGGLLIKPHGSFPGTGGKREPSPHDYDLLFESSEVWQLDPIWRARLEDDCAGRDVFLFGYRGADPDLTPAILTALTHSRSATWWDCDTENIKRLNEFVDPDHVCVSEGDPSAGLRALAMKRAGFIEEPAPAEHPLSEVDYKLLYEPTHESRAGLAGAISAANRARRLRLQALVLDKEPDRRKLTISLLRSAGYDWAPARGPIASLFSRGMRRAGVSSEDRERMAALYLTLVDARPLRRSDAGAIAEVRDLGLDASAQVAVRIASIEKLHGDLVLARMDAERALAAVGDNPLLEGMIRYNLAWIYRQQGDFGRRRGLISELRDLYPHIGPNWSAWLDLDNALFALQTGDVAVARKKAYGQFMTFVGDSIGHPAYAQDADTTRALVDWHESGPEHALELLRTEIRTRPVSRLLPPRYSSITTLLLIADNARAQGNASEALRLLRRARGRALSKLQQVQIDLVEAFTDTDAERLRTVEADAREKGFGLVAGTAEAAAAVLQGRPGPPEFLVRSELPLPALY